MISQSKIPGAGRGVFSTREEPFEVGSLMIKYGDKIMSMDEWFAASRSCSECGGDEGDEESIANCNQCNRTMEAKHDLVAISTEYDPSGYINHSSDPNVINMEKVRM
jgi:hypothetical protein